MDPAEIRERQAFIKRCDPNEPLDAGDPLYVALDEGAPVRGGDGASAIDDLQQTVLLADAVGSTCQLFSGFPGTGKTTELRRLKARLNQDKITPTHVVMVDFEEYIDKYTPISITDILRILAYAMDRDATTEEALAAGKDPASVQPGYMRRLFNFLTHTDVQLKQIGFEQWGTGLMLEIKDNPSFRQRVEDALAVRFQQFAQEAVDVMSESVVRLRKVTHSQRIVLIADGLEKLAPLREEDRNKIEASVETVFAQNASWLRLPCHVIYTFPLWLRYRTPMLGARYDCEPQILPMIKITEPDGNPYTPGFVKLTELVSRRVDVRRIFGDSPSETLLPLISASGGYPRELIRMVRELLYRSRKFPVTPRDCQVVLDRLGESYALGVREPDVDILVEIATTHALPRGDEARLASFGRLLDRWLVLAYRNGREWYDLHPLVRRAPAVQERLTKSQ